MEAFLEILKQPFTLGLMLGLLLTFFVWKTGFTAKRHLKVENNRLSADMKELQGHLKTQLKISATGNETLSKSLEELKEKNENLRVSIANLQQKPEKSEMRHLHITDAAVRMMREQAPGFATAWEKALRAAEEEYIDSENGISKLIRKVMPKYGSAPVKDTQAIEMKDS